MLAEQPRYGCRDALHHERGRVGFVVGLSRQQLHLYASHLRPRAVCGYELHHVRVGFLKLRSHHVRPRIGNALALKHGSMGEERVVKIYNVALRAIVGFQTVLMGCVRRVLKLGVYVVEQAPVAFAPSVDALLHVAHDEVCSAVLMTETLEQQDLEVGPLNGARVLKLVNHDVVDLRAYLLIYERRVVLPYEPVEHILCVAKQEAVVLNVVFAHGLRYASEQTQLVHVCQHLLRGLIVVPLASARALGLFKQGRELVVSESFQQRAVWSLEGRLCEPCVGVGESLTVGCEQLARLLVVEGRRAVVAAL